MELKLLAVMTADIYEDEVRDAFREGLGGYLEMPRLFGEMGSHRRLGSVEAPGEARLFFNINVREKLQPVIDRLERFAARCGEEPCLKMMVLSVDEIF
ncbi:MAG: hypothetical protein GW824_11465 [Deltaproteobacteria bacterium]|nr:hypothetical protein [Deltaproteobacteria bacterium]